jgi:hypothetical protein
VREYAQLEAAATDAVARFVADVRTGRYPSSAETYHMTDRMGEALGLEGAVVLDDAAPERELTQ